MTDNYPGGCTIKRVCVCGPPDSAGGLWRDFVNESLNSYLMKRTRQNNATSTVPPGGLPIIHACVYMTECAFLDWRGSKKDHQLKIIGTNFINSTSIFNQARSSDKLLLHFLCHQLDAPAWEEWKEEKHGHKERTFFWRCADWELVAKVLCDLFHIPQPARVRCANSNSSVGEVWLSRCYFLPCPPRQDEKQTEWRTKAERDAQEKKTIPN